MAKIKRLIPFRAMPASWGLVGQYYEEAEAAYYYDGEDLDRELVKIRNKDNINNLARENVHLDFKYGHIEELDRDLRIADLDELDEFEKLEIKHKHGAISDYEFDKQTVVDDGSKEAKIALLEVELTHGKITENEFQKERANVLDEPWIGIINQGFDPNKGIDGVYFEFDWNDKWIEFLRLNGYTGRTEEMIVQQWFEDVCQVDDDDDLPGEIRLTQ